MAKQRNHWTRNKLVDLYLLMDFMKEKLNTRCICWQLLESLDGCKSSLLAMQCMHWHPSKVIHCLGKKNGSLTSTYSLKRFCIGRRPSVVWSLLTLFLKLVESGVPHKVGQLFLLCYQLLHNRWKGKKKSVTGKRCKLELSSAAHLKIVKFLLNLLQRFLLGSSWEEGMGVSALYTKYLNWCLSGDQSYY